MLCVVFWSPSIALLHKIGCARISAKDGIIGRISHVGGAVAVQLPRQIEDKC